MTTMNSPKVSYDYNEYSYSQLLYRYTHFYTAANVHFTNRQVLQINHTSLAIEKFLHEKPSERYQQARVFMLRETGTNEL